MLAMLGSLAVLALTLLPLLTVVALLALAGWRERRRLAIVARQIALTDAIARELGGVVAPVVSRRLLGMWGSWRVAIAVPFGRPATVGTILDVAHRVLGRAGDEGWEIVLTPQEAPVRRGERPSAAASTCVGARQGGVSRGRIERLDRARTSRVPT